MIFRNSAAVTAAMISGYLFSFVLAPVMLARLGLAQFGVWAVTGAFVTYAGLMDLGITRALGRFVALADARGDRVQVERLFGLGLLVVTGVLVVAAGLAFATAPLVAGALGDVLTTNEMRAVLLSVAAIFVLGGYRSVIRSVPEGMQRMVPAHLAEIAAGALNFALSLTALILSRDLVVYAAANVVAALLALGPSWYALRTVCGPFRPRLPSAALAREVLGFSLKFQLYWIGELVNNQTDKVIIALLVDVRAAGAFEIANRVVNAVKAVAVLSMSGLAPTATQRMATHGTSMIPEFYRHYTRRTLGLAFALIGFICASAPAMLAAWLGDVPADAATIFVVLTLANAFSLATGVAFTLVTADGRAGEIARVSMLSVGLNVTFTLALAPFFGLWGVIAGTAAAIVLSSLVFLWRFHRRYALRAGALVAAVRTPLALVLLAVAPIVALRAAGVLSYDDRLDGAIASAAFLGLFAAVYWPLASKARLLPQPLRVRRVARRLLRRGGGSAVGAT